MEIPSQVFFLLNIFLKLSTQINKIRNKMTKDEFHWPLALIRGNDRDGVLTKLDLKIIITPSWKINVYGMQKS